MALPGTGIVPEKNQQRTQDLVDDQGNPGAFQAHTQHIDGKDRQSRTHQQHGEEGDHSGHLGVTGTAQGTSQNQLGGLERLYQCHKHHDLSAQIHQ